MAVNPYAWIEPSLDAIHRANWRRSVQEIQGMAGATVSLEGRTVINFASNDYLGLAGDRRLIEAAIAAIQTYGVGSTGSRLLSGHRPLHRQLERAIADLKQTEDGIVFSSGYLANLGAVSALTGRRDLILADQYNHSSLKHGAILSGATVIDYAHCDPGDLQRRLEQHRDRYRRGLILTDSVFSMDGDLCPLADILDLADQFECMVLVDEAHGSGVLGATGAGCVEHLGCTGRPVIQMGTLSKAFGSLGGYVAGSAKLIDFLRNRAATWIYTTGLSPADTAAALAAIAIVRHEPERRARLHQQVAYLKHRLAAHFPKSASEASGFTQLPSESPIVCLQVKDAATVMAVGKHLKDAGIFAAAIRPPTTPTSRLRMSVMATHTEAQIDQLIGALRQYVAH